MYHSLWFQARVALYSNNEPKSEILSLVFNATNSSNVNWFSRDRLTHSPWPNLFNESLLIFNLQGCCGRTFYITKSHGGCPLDFGWLLVSFKDCAYESRLPQTTVMYSNRTNYTNWNSYGENISQAYFKPSCSTQAFTDFRVQ